MKFSSIFIFAAIAFLTECGKVTKASRIIDTKAVKKTSSKPVTSTVKKVKVNPNETKEVTVKDTKHPSGFTGNTAKAAKLEPSRAKTTRQSETKPKANNNIKTGKFEEKDKKNTYWSPKSIIVPLHKGNRDAVIDSHISRNPILDNLYQERYEALEKVSAINNKINMLLNRKLTADGDSHPFLSPGAIDSGPYRVQGGKMFLGPANAGDVVGLDYTGKRRDESPAETLQTETNDTVSDSPSYVNPGDPLADMPQPMYGDFDSPYNETSQANKSQNVSSTKRPNDADALATMDDQLVLGDPEMFDSVCSVLKLTFEHTQGSMVLDDSPQTNNAELEHGAFVSMEKAKSGLSMNVGEDGYMDVPDNFKGKPTKAAAVSMWVKLNSVDGKNPLFQAYDNDTIHYEVAIIDGKASWTHRDDLGKKLFNVTTKATFTPEKWHHIVGVYSNKKKEATLWLDGKKVGSQKGVSGPLSQNWDKLSIFKGKTAGTADNVFMFRCSLDRTKVVALYVAAASPKDAKKSSIPKVKPSQKKNSFFNNLSIWT